MNTGAYPVADTDPDSLDNEVGGTAPVARSRCATEMTSYRLLRRSPIPVHETERLIRAVTGAARSEVAGGLRLDGESAATLEVLIRRRAAGEPLQYLEGTVQFGPIEISVDRRVLIPRPETEQLWDRAMRLLPGGPAVVVDIGTGSGCLALAIKHRRPEVTVVATDISSEALAMARQNAARLELEVEFRQGDGLAALDPSPAATVDMIVTNPPYISEDGWTTLPPEVRDHEPRVALVAGDGLDMYRGFAAEAAAWLTPRGMLVAEIGALQGMEITRLFKANGWEALIERDWTGRDRFLIARAG